MAVACLFRGRFQLINRIPSCSRRPVGDVTCGQATSALRFPHGSGYKIRVREYPKLPPRLQRIFAHNALFFVTFCTYKRRKLLASDAVHAAFVGLPGTSPIWQRGFFDHVLRNDESYGHKWNYVRENPVRAGLVTKADDWPYSGEIVLIDRA